MSVIFLHTTRLKIQSSRERAFSDKSSNWASQTARRRSRSECYNRPYANVDDKSDKINNRPYISSLSINKTNTSPRKSAVTFCVIYHLSRRRLSLLVTQREHLYKMIPLDILPAMSARKKTQQTKQRKNALFPAPDRVLLSGYIAPRTFPIQYPIQYNAIPFLECDTVTRSDLVPDRAKTFALCQYSWPNMLSVLKKEINDQTPATVLNDRKKELLHGAEAICWIAR